MTKEQIDMYMLHTTRLLYLQHMPLAEALAHWANAQGGKSKGGKPLPPERTFKPEEFLFRMARWKPYMEETQKPTSLQMGIDRETAQLIIALNTYEKEGKRSSKLEPWMIRALNSGWDEIMAVAGS